MRKYTYTLDKCDQNVTFSRQVAFLVENVKWKEFMK